MPRYFFDLYDDVNVIDEEGRVRADLDSAKATALIEAREIIQANVRDFGKFDVSHRIEVRDESGAIVHTIHFDDAVEVLLEGRPL